MIVFDNTQDDQSLGSAQSWSFSYTTAGSNKILFIGFTITGSTSDLITTAQYAGVNLTLLDHFAEGTEHQYFYMLVNPADGANNFSFAISGGVDKIPLYAVASYNMVLQTGQPDNHGVNNTTASSVAVTLSTSADNCWTVCYVRYLPGGISAGAGTTARTSGGNLASGFGIFDSNAPITPPGNTTLTVNGNAGSGAIGMLMASFSPTLTVSTLPGYFIGNRAPQPVRVVQIIGN